MGEIVKTQTREDKIVYRVELEEKEAQQLRNHIKNVHLFAGNMCVNDSKIIARGNKGGAKYFSIPLTLKTRKKKKYNKISYQKLEIKNKIFFICVVEKDPLF